MSRTPTRTPPWLPPPAPRAARVLLQRARVRASLGYVRVLLLRCGRRLRSMRALLPVGSWLCDHGMRVVTRRRAGKTVEREREGMHADCPTRLFDFARTKLIAYIARSPDFYASTLEARIALRPPSPSPRLHALTHSLPSIPLPSSPTHDPQPAGSDLAAPAAPPPPLNAFPPTRTMAQQHHAIFRESSTAPWWLSSSTSRRMRRCWRSERAITPAGRP